MVDDEPAIRRSLRRFLERRGCRVQEAEDGGDARTRLQQEAFDVVITDLEMRPEDGVSLCTWMGAERPELQRRTVVYSSRELPPTLALNGLVYLPKPCPLPDLWAAIEGMMAGSS